jgi:hypothetical protein
VTDILTVGERLRDAADLFEKKNTEYGSAYRQFGPLMKALFPNGFGPGDLTVEELGRLSHIVFLGNKLIRYAQNLRRNGHGDSMEDMAVYAMMSAELDDTVVLAPEPEKTGGYVARSRK